MNIATINNLAGASFISSGSLGIDNSITNDVGVNAFNNFGTLSKVGGNNLVISVPFNNAGLVQIQQGTIQFNGPFTQSSATGRIVMAGGNLYYPGTLAIQGGSLEGNGNVVGDVQLYGNLLPGQSAGALTFIGSLALQSSTNTVVELGGTAMGAYDRINVMGPLTLGGSLQVSLTNGFTPAPGTSFDILDWGTLSGNFSTVQLPPLPGTLSWNTTQLYSTGVLSVVNR